MQPSTEPKVIGSRFYDTLMQLSKSQPDAIALLSSQSEVTYQVLADRVLVIVSTLAGVGVSSQSVVGISLKDEIDHFSVTLALFIMGCKQITLASHDTIETRLRLMDQTKVTTIISDVDSSFVRENIRVIDGNICKKPSFAKAQNECYFRGVESEGTIYLRTSGTTQQYSNIIPFSESQIIAQSMRHPEYSDERLLRLASIEHNNSKRHRLYCFVNGGCNVFKDNTMNVIDFIHSYKVTCLDISRMHVADLLQDKNFFTLNNIKLRTGGSDVPWAIRSKVLSHISNLYVRYASSETGGISMACPREHDIQETSGKPLRGVDIQIVDDNDAPLEIGLSGEIRIKADGIATEYLNNPELSSKRFRNGWFYPGDIGKFRSDGQLIVLGRADDMMILNGINIFPYEIERELENHPAVCMAAAFPISSQIHGSIPVAAVELHKDNAVSTQELLRYAREVLSLRAPRKIVILDKLPVNPQGKLLKREMAKHFEIKDSNG
jgi:long-chain acyl-CoA synthetase